MIYTEAFSVKIIVMYSTYYYVESMTGEVYSICSWEKIPALHPFITSPLYFYPISSLNVNLGYRTIASRGSDRKIWRFALLRPLDLDNPSKHLLLGLS